MKLNQILCITLIILNLKYANAITIYGAVKNNISCYNE